jgi:hypothetical protein
VSGPDSREHALHDARRLFEASFNRDRERGVDGVLTFLIV